MRSSTSYSNAQARALAVEGAIEISTPIAGFFRFRLHSGAVFGGVQIWHGPPADPVTGEELDRSWRWQARFNGEDIDLDRVWPACAANPITAAEYRQFIKAQAWARKHAPDSAHAERGRRIDPLSTAEILPF